MKRLFVALGLMFGVLFVVGAQSLTANYVQGPVSIQSGASWADLFIGDTVAANAVIRLGDNAYAEISNGSVTIKLTKAGTYAMKDLFARSQAVQTAGLNNLLASRIASLGKSQETTSQTTIGGVRASEAPSGPQTQWAGGGDATSLIQEGLTQLTAGNYNEAYYNFSDAYDAADNDLAPEARFYMGYAAYLKGDVPNALKYLTTFKPKPNDSYYASQELTLAQIQVETFDYQDALTVLDGFLKNGNPTGDNLQTAYLLQGLAYQGMGNATQARTALQTARDQNPASAVGQSAAKVLAGL